MRRPGCAILCASGRRGPQTRRYGTAQSVGGRPAACALAKTNGPRAPAPGGPGGQEDTTALDILRGSELFHDLETGHLEQVAGMCRDFSGQAGTVIFREGEHASDLYVLGEGRVALELDIVVAPGRPPVPTTVDLIGPGDCFGWSALVEPNRYTASARCINPSRGVAIPGDALLQVMTRTPALGHEVMRRLAQVVSNRLDLTRTSLSTQIARLLDRGDEW